MKPIMRTLNYLAIFIAMAVTTVSCVESSSKYKSVVAQRDSLLIRADTIEQEYNEIVAIVNDVESGFNEITQNEGKMMVELRSNEGNTASKREKVATRLSLIKDVLAQNKEKIAQLKARLNKSGKKNTALQASLDRLESELNEKTTAINALQAELAKKNIKIEELVTTVDSLHSNINKLNDLSEQQLSTIQTQDKDLNTVWYCIATEKDLKSAKVITSGGLFGTKKVLDRDFDSSIFIKGDLRGISTIETGSKHIKILSSHPKDSYELVVGTDKIVTIKILAPAKFWSISKYLVIKK